MNAKDNRSDPQGGSGTQQGGQQGAGTQGAQQEAYSSARGQQGAAVEDGVLDVCFDAPRTPQQQTRQIEIRDGSMQASGSSAAGKR